MKIISDCLLIFLLASLIVSSVSVVFGLWEEREGTSWFNGNKCIIFTRWMSKLFPVLFISFWISMCWKGVWLINVNFCYPDFFFWQSKIIVFFFMKMLVWIWTWHMYNLMVCNAKKIQVIKRLLLKSPQEWFVTSCFNQICIW